MPAPVIDYSECLRDSPRFRQQLSMNEASLEDLEGRLERVLKMCGNMIDGGKNYVTQQTQFLAGLWELSSYFASDQEANTTATLNKLIHALQEVVRFQNLLIDQTSRTVSRNLSKFLAEDIKQMKETKGYFNKISNDLDSALNKNAAVNKSHPAALDDASNLLTATRSCFRYTGMDYVFQISMLQAKKRHVILDSLVSYMNSYKAFFHQGYDLFTDFDPFLKQVSSEIQVMQESCVSLEKNLEKRHTYVTQPDTLSLADTIQPGKPVKIEGYLFKRGSSAFRTWNRRWFYLDNNKLCYAKRSGDEVTVMEDDLRICLVRPITDIDRRFCFEVLSPTKSHVLQADSQDMYDVWVSSLQQGISTALHEAMDSDNGNDTSSGAIQWEDSDTEEAQDRRGAGRAQPSARQIVDIPGNQCCCDCGAIEPQWASINFGVTLCIECGGIHRGMGVHISKVRSITLDAWEPEILKVMAELGNNIVNNILEAQVGEGDVTKPTSTSDRATREKWITAKYRDKAFVNRDVWRCQETENKSGLVVKRLRRRARSGKRQAKPLGEKEGRDSEEKEVDTSENSDILESVLRVSTLAHGGSLQTFSSDLMNASQQSVVNAETVLFGGSLGKHHVASIQLDSDQESTDGEETNWSPATDSLASLTPELLLYRAARAHNLPVMCQAVALGANLDWKNEREDNRSAIHQSIESGSVMACEFLILNGAKTTAADENGDTALHIAAKHGSTGQVCLLLKHRANHHLVNNNNKQPLDIAVANSDADIVTLLRLAALNEEIRESDMTGDDDTFNDVVQEFSQMVYTHPERLHKKEVKGKKQ